jgi:hypothetical protein
LKKQTLFFILFLFMAANLPAGDTFNKAGRTALQFLKIGMGARPAGMGEAVIANIHDVTAVFWNPAAITGIQRAEAAFGYTKWFADLNFTSGAVGFRIGNMGVLAVDYIALDYGQIQEALTTSSSGGLDTRTGKTFGGSDLALGLTYSRMYTDKLSIGVRVKYLREELFTFTSSSWAFDVGSYYETGWKGVRLAMSAQNFAGPMRWLKTGEEERQSFDIPLVFRVGCSVDLLGGKNLVLGGNADAQRLSLSVDAIHTNDYAERIHMGMEYWLYNLLCMRAGYRFNYSEGNLSIGGGIQYNTHTMQIHFDYAYVDYDFLDSPHRLSMSVAF